MANTENAQLTGEPKVRCDAGLADTVKSKNGDTLKELNERWLRVQPRIAIARRECGEAKAAFAKACAALHSVESEAENIKTRMDIWWREQRDKLDVS